MISLLAISAVKSLPFSGNRNFAIVIAIRLLSLVYTLSDLDLSGGGVGRWVLICWLNQRRDLPAI